jgi:hypothetical protein
MVLYDGTVIPTSRLGDQVVVFGELRPSQSEKAFALFLYQISVSVTSDLRPPRVGIILKRATLQIRSLLLNLRVQSIVYSGTCSGKSQNP